MIRAYSILRPALLFAAAVLVTSPGCADRSAKDRVQPSVRVERAAEAPPMSQRQRAQAFHDA